MRYFEDKLQEVLLTEEQIRQKVAELGAQITKDYEGKELVIVGILRGSLVFAADLMRQIDLPLVLDTMVVASYGMSTKSSGIVKINKDLETDISGKHVLIVEDIVDTGLTLNYLLKNLESREAASVKICTFLDKPERREKDVDISYMGFAIPNEFVVGYGLDFNQQYRNYPAVAVLKPETYE